MTSNHYIALALFLGCLLSLVSLHQANTKCKLAQVSLSSRESEFKVTAAKSVWILNPFYCGNSDSFLKNPIPRLINYRELAEFERRFHFAIVNYANAKRVAQREFIRALSMIVACATCAFGCAIFKWWLRPVLPDRC